MEKTDKKITEWCSHCEQEVEIPSTFKLHKCPNCGALIAPCTLCNPDTCDCANCKLNK